MNICEETFYHWVLILVTTYTYLPPIIVKYFIRMTSFYSHNHFVRFECYPHFKDGNNDTWR